jgi:hypothetical protein
MMQFAQFINNSLSFNFKKAFKWRQTCFSQIEKPTFAAQLSNIKIFASWQQNC